MFERTATAILHHKIHKSRVAQVMPLYYGMAQIQTIEVQQQTPRKLFYYHGTISCISQYSNQLKGKPTNQSPTETTEEAVKSQSTLNKRRILLRRWWLHYTGLTYRLEKINDLMMEVKSWHHRSASVLTQK